MRKSIRRILLTMSIVLIVFVSSESNETAYCANCPKAQLDGDNFIQCLDGQEAWCKSGPKCGCQGQVSKTNECGGACSVQTNWGKCSIQCPKGVQASCVQGSKTWQGMEQIITEPKCSCGGSGSVGIFGIDPAEKNATAEIADPKILFSKEFEAGS